MEIENEIEKSNKIAAKMCAILSYFTKVDSWNVFYTTRGIGDSFEWFADWSVLCDLFTDLKVLPPKESDPRILVPGCGSSSLSQVLYDDGYTNIWNIDFSKVVIADMLNLMRGRPSMIWRVMDMTSIKFKEDDFDVVLDKGGLDSLMLPKALATKQVNEYLSEVRRVLKSGGKFVCFTLAEPHILGLLLFNLRSGWKISFHVIPQKPSMKPNLHTFMVIAEKGNLAVSHQISPEIERSSYQPGHKVYTLLEALKQENETRALKSLRGSYMNYSLDDLKRGVLSGIRDLNPGRRLVFCEERNSSLGYRAVLLDAKESVQFQCSFYVLVVPKARAYERQFSDEEEQFKIIQQLQAARMLVVFLDSRHDDNSKDHQDFLSPLAMELTPVQGLIMYNIVSDGLSTKKKVCKTEQLTVQDVEFNFADSDKSFAGLKHRCLIYESTGLEHSRAELVESRQTSTQRPSSSKKGGRIKKQSSVSKGHLKVCHTILVRDHHYGIVAGLMLHLSFLQRSFEERTLNTVVVGLGAGVLPMFLHDYFPSLHIMVVESDATVLKIATDFFDFKEQERLKVCISDGIQFVRDVKLSKTSEGSNVSSDECEKKGEGSNKIDILIIEVYSSNTSSGHACPTLNFVEESFLSTIKDSLSDQGCLVIYLLTSSPLIRETVVSSMKKVFINLFLFRNTFDIGEVLFALNTSSDVGSSFVEMGSTFLTALENIKRDDVKEEVMKAIALMQPLSSVKL